MKLLDGNISAMRHRVLSVTLDDGTAQAEKQMEDTMEIGNNIKQLRTNKGITQEQLAEHLHISGHEGVIIGLN